MICKEVLNYSNTNEMLRILLIVGCYIQKTVEYQICTFAKGLN